MDLSLTRRGDYVVRAAICLARAYARAGYCKIREVAEEMDLPRSYTPQILGVLVQAGLAEARAGRDGGYRLLRDPSRISLLELVEAGEGPLRPSRCSLRGGPCRWDDMCAIHPAWDAATRAIEDSLGSTSLAALADVDAGLASGVYPIPETSHRRQARGGDSNRQEPSTV
ncbi:MAG: Rrf2 family transcriptional regulator [Candidatus Dormibacteraeota bacterium]|nr:Rrf2 family transcriptional regulator [Candidatus Dormibacteraeota bacterium]MBO0761573.1 Rrf2 family transcriptional regulator [Candidatus Dormibacteraeota bacterium]